MENPRESERQKPIPKKETQDATHTCRARAAGGMGQVLRRMGFTDVWAALYTSKIAY